MLSKDTDEDDVHPIHCVLVVVEINRLLSVDEDFAVMDTWVLQNT